MKKLFFSIFLIISLSNSVFSQAELVHVSNKIYSLLDGFHKRGLIENYNSANIPLSRNSISNYITEIAKQKNKLSSTEKEILEDFKAYYCSL